MFLSKRFVKVIDWIAVVIFVTAAVFVTTLRVSLPSLDRYKNELLPYLNQEIGAELMIEHIHATWHDFGPVLVAQGVTVKEDPNYELANIGDVEFQFNFWDSLWKGELFFKKIFISNAQIDLTQQKKNKSSSNEFSVDTLEAYVSEIFGTQKGFLQLSNINLKIRESDKKIANLAIDELRWQNVNSTHHLKGQLHVDLDEAQLKLKGDVLVYLGEGQNWGVEAISAAFQSNDNEWHPFNVKYLRQGYLNTLNIDNILLEDIHPLIHTIVSPGIENANIHGELTDLRIAWGRELLSPQFSFSIKDIAIEKNQKLPQIQNISLSVMGTLEAGYAHLAVTDNTALSSHFLTTDLNIFPSVLDAKWYKKDQGYALWSDNVALKTSNVDVDAKLFMDIPDNGLPFLSAYADFSLNDMRHLIDYFPENSVGEETMRFIRDGFAGGHSEKARAIWYGKLDAYPFKEYQGTLQVNADLKDVNLTFEKHWPAIDKLDANFELRDDDIFITSSYAKTMSITGKNLKAKIPHFLTTTWFELSGDLKVSSGKKGQDYLLKTPLRDSVAPALDSVKIQKAIDINLNLNIPFTNSNYRAWGYVGLNNNSVHIEVPSLDFSQAKGRLYFDNEKINIKKLTANLYKQPVRVTLKGDQKGKNYHIDIGMTGSWDIRTLNRSLDLNALKYVSGRTPWGLDVDLDVTRDDVLFKVFGSVKTANIKSRLPYPLNKIATNTKGVPQSVKVSLQGGGKAFRMNVTSPKIKYASRYRVNKDDLVITSSVLSVGRNVKANKQRYGHHTIHAATDYADGDKWLPIIFDIIEEKPNPSNEVKGLPVGSPEFIRLDVSKLKLGGLDWYKSGVDAWRKRKLWSLDIIANEAIGTVEIYDHRPWLAHFKKLFVFYHPDGPEMKPGDPGYSSMPKVKSAKATEFDKDLFRLMPDFTLKADDFWFQGFSLGKVAGTVRRIGDHITWKDITVAAGSIRAKSHGKWTIKKGTNYTNEYITLKANNNSEILDRMGISGGIRGSSVDFATDLNWQGTLWGIKSNTLNGNLSLSMGKGVVKSISGTTNLVGLLSLDSLLKKIRLDFSGIFEDGLAVDGVKAHATMSRGILTTTDATVNAVPGNMKIKGIMDFNRDTLDLRVNFIPDFASGVPVITAFAISPPAAVLVFAVSKVLSPVLDVITEINYSVTGSFYAPQVREISRNSGEIAVPRQ